MPVEDHAEESSSLVLDLPPTVLRPLIADKVDEILAQGVADIDRGRNGAHILFHLTSWITEVMENHMRPEPGAKLVNPIK